MAIKKNNETNNPQQSSSIAGVFADTTTETPDFTPAATGTATFELTVTDP